MDLPAAALTFRPYGLTHLVIVVLTVVGAVLLVRLGRRHRNTPAGETFTRIFAIIQLTVTLGFMIVWLVPPLFDLHQSLPLHLSDILRLVTAYALWSRRPWAFALTYYWGLTINPQAILTPDLQLDIAPALEFASYWLQHVLVMWAAVYLTWGLGLRPTWRSYRLALAVTVAWRRSSLPSTVLWVPITATSTANRAAPRYWTSWAGGPGICLQSWHCWRLSGR